MKNSSKLIIAALALGSSAWIATAQTTNAPPMDGAPHGGPGMRGHRPPPFIAVLDANHDGVIDADEIANASVALKKLDKNGDGQITLQEFLGPRRGGPPHADGAPPGGGFGGGTNSPPVPPIFAALDANSDGVIDTDELANAPAALVKLDKNGDGNLTIDEMLPPRPGGRGGFGGGGRERGPGGHGGFGGPPPDDDQAPPTQAPSQE